MYRLKGFIRERNILIHMPGTNRFKRYSSFWPASQSPVVCFNFNPIRFKPFLTTASKFKDIFIKR